MGSAQDIANSAVSDTLFQAWTAPDPRERARLVAQTRAPGEVALRARWHFMRGLTPLENAPLPSMTRRLWDEIIILESQGDEAVKHSSSPQAEVAFQQLLDLDDGWPHLSTVHALIGLGDVARLAEDAPAAAELYTRAIDRAREAGHRFGELRAAVALGYVAMAYGSVTDAVRAFDGCVTIAGELQEELYRANALLGRGEAKNRLRDDSAQDDVYAAYTLFSALGSPVGCGNAAERLASLRRAAGDLPAATDYLREAARWQQISGDSVGVCNTLDRLGDVELDRQRPSEAAAAFEQARALARKIPYLRGVNNAELGLAQCLLARGDWPAARAAFEENRLAHQSLSDLASTMKCFEGLALCARHLGGPAAEVEVRIDSVRELEQVRAASVSAEVQREYRTRFREMYAAALRSTIEAQDPEAALFVLECAAGRRLAGLVQRTIPASAGADVDFWAQAAALADQRISGRWVPEPKEDPSQRLMRLLGATAILGTARHEVSDRVAQTAASFFLPLDRADVRDLLSDLPRGIWCVIVVLELHAADELVVWWRDPEGNASVGSSAIPPGVQDWWDDAQHGPGQALEHPGLALLPEELRSAVLRQTSTTDVLIVPIGQAWRIPWSALRLPDETLLGERARITLTPSLTMHRVLRQRGADAREHARDRWLWSNPTLHNFGFDHWDEMRQLASAAQVTPRLQDPSTDLIAVVSHGRGAGDTAYLELDVASTLPITQLLDAGRSGLARRVAFVACQSAVTNEPMEPFEDPFTFATLALVAGAQEVLGTCSELADSPQASMMLRAVLGHRGDSFAEALHHASALLLKSPIFRSGGLVHWAPLITVGVVHGRGEDTEGEAAGVV